MNTTAHTPGPWKVCGPFDEESDLFIRTRIDGEPFDIANLNCDETGQHKANAALIASAPDLLKERDELRKKLEFANYQIEQSLIKIGRISDVLHDQRIVKNEFFEQADDLRQEKDGLKSLNAELLEALKGLYQHCAMIHSQWGEGSNQKQADEAIQRGKQAIAKAEGRTTV